MIIKAFMTLLKKIVLTGSKCPFYNTELDEVKTKMVLISKFFNGNEMGIS